MLHTVLVKFIAGWPGPLAHPNVLVWHIYRCKMQKRCNSSVVDLRLNKRLTKQSRCRSFKMPLRSLWYHCDVLCLLSEQKISGFQGNISKETADAIELWDVWTSAGIWITEVLIYWQRVIVELKHVSGPSETSCTLCLWSLLPCDQTFGTS